LSYPYLVVVVVVVVIVVVVIVVAVVVVVVVVVAVVVVLLLLLTSICCYVFLVSTYPYLGSCTISLAQLKLNVVDSSGVQQALKI